MVKYIFTDKTGTLTMNQMLVRCLTVGDRSYGMFKENSSNFGGDGY